MFTSTGLIMMPRGRPTVHCHKDIGPVMEEDSPPFCFSCEQLFPDRTWLEEHSCAAVSYICSCGTEFSYYIDMLEHSGEHEPGYAVLNHATIQMRRLAKHQEQEEQLRKLESVGQGPSTGPTCEITPSACTTTYSSQLPFRSAQMPKMPLIYTRISKGHLLSEPIPTSTFNAPANLESLTVDLWPKFQPVVLIKTSRKCAADKPYCCSKCVEGFTTKDNLIVHYSTHVEKKVFGCLGCGELLSGNKSMPHHHLCDSASTKFNPKFITACPKQNYRSSYGLLNENFRRGGPVTFPKDLKRLTLPKQIKGFNCRICQVSFATIQLLQRHKCIKAHEFVNRQAMLFAKHPNRCMKEKSLKDPYPYPHRNVQKMFGINIQASSHVYHNKAARPETFPDGATKKEIDVDDDCYVVESSPGNSTQVFQQLSSAIPVIKI